MKICFVSSAHPKFDKRVFQKEACALASFGHDVIHLAPGTDYRSEVVRGVVVREYPSRPGILGRMRQSFTLFNAAKELRADFYHANEFDSWIICVLLRLFRRARVVFDIHEFYPEMFGDRRFPKAMQPLARGLITSFYFLFMFFTYRIVLANKNIISDIPRIHQKRCVIVENFGHRPDAFDAEARATRPDGVLRIIHVGLFNRERGSFSILDALELTQVKAIKVTLIGKITDMTVDDYRTEIATRGLQGRVEVVDWLAYDDLVNRMREADMGVVFFRGSSKTNRFGLPHKLFDYMSNGLAVLASTQAHYVSEIVADSRAGWVVDPDEPDQLARLLDQLSGDLMEIRIRGRNGMNAVLTKYNWEAEFEKLAQVYQV